MTRRSLRAGLFAGTLASFLLIMPTWQLFIARLLPQLPLRISELDPTRLVPMLVLVGIAFMVLCAAPVIATLHPSARDSRASAFKGGSITAVAAILILFILLVFPTNAAQIALGAYAEMVPYGPVALEGAPATPAAPADALQPVLRRIIFAPFVTLLESLAVAAVLGGLIGASAGLIARRRAAAGPGMPAAPCEREPSPWACLDVAGALDQPAVRRRLWNWDEEPLRVGLIAGLLYGIVILMLLFVGVFAAGIQRGFGLEVEMFAPHFEAASRILASVASPLVAVLLLLVGALPVALLRHPTSRLRSRVYSAVVTGATAGVICFPGIEAILFLFIVFQPYIAADTLQVVAVAPVLDWQRLASQVAGIYLIAIVGLMLFVYLWVILAGIQGLGYGLLLPAFHRRPVDRAAQLGRRLQGEPRGPLPAIYALANTDPAVSEVLAHLALSLREKQPDAAHVVAAYHQLAGRPEQAEQALAAIDEVLARHAEWRWQSDIRTLHRLVLAGLQARAIPQILAIAPIAEDQTTSLPPAVARLSRALSDSLSELKKLERVPEAGAKLIFLNNALERLHLAEHTTGVKRQAGALPEQGAVVRMLANAQSIILEAIKELQGRARLIAELQAHKLSYAPRLSITLRIANTGLNVAEGVRLELQPGEGYRLAEDAEQRLDLLAPGEERLVNCTLLLDRPRGVRADARLRLQWRLVYDDAVDERRELAFADVLEFAEDEKPFQRIFPIPYVTGTPLQTGHLFVGREDVFAFVREHLMGAYQNNVIVLHGQRRTGKTSILYRLKDVLAETHVCVLIDMQGKAARGTADFLYAVADDIAYALESAGCPVELPPRGEFEQSPEFFFKSRFLRGAVARMGTRNLLLMFDEFEELQKRVEDGKLDAGIFATLRNLMQHEPRVNFIFAGTHKLEELGADYWSILFNIAAYKQITFLGPNEVRALVVDPVAPFGLEYDPQAVERIFQVAGGHPYFTQVICHELVAYHNDTQRNYLTASDVDEALGHIVERGEAHFKYIWSESAPGERHVLLALAYLLDHQDAATPAEIQGKAEKLGLGGDISPALRSLEARDILLRTAAAGGIGAPDLYRFRIDLIRKWIYRARPAI